MDERNGRPRVLHLATVDTTVRFLLLVQMEMLARAGYDVAAMAAPGPYVDEIEAAGVRFIPWRNATRRWAPAADARAFAELLTVLRRERFDLVHTHTPKPGLFGRVAARTAGVRAVVHTTHGLYSTPGEGWSPRKALLAAEWTAARFSHFELYQSAEDLARARRLRIAGPKRSGYLGNGIDLGRFDPARTDTGEVERLRHRLDIPPGAPVVGMVGRLVREKGWRDFFETARAVRAARPDAVFVAIGPEDGDKADALRPDELRAAAGHVRFAGMLTAMPEALSLLDVFVLASYREGFPRSAIEAAAMGKPLVLTDIRGCREAVRDGEGGFLVPPRHPGELARAIGQLLDEPDLRARMGRANRERARREFDERLVVRRTLAVYRALLKHDRHLSLVDEPIPERV